MSRAAQSTPEAGAQLVLGSARMPRGPWLTVLLVLSAACRDSAPEASGPRFEAAGEVDPLVLARVRAAEAACERGEPGSLLELAKVYDANGLDNLALEAYSLCLRRGEAGARPAELAFHRGRVLEELGRAPEAIAAYGEALALADDYGPLRWRRGGLLLEAGRIDEARADYERALALEPESVPASLGLARTLLALDRPHEARTLLEGVLARRPKQRSVHGLLSRVYLALGDEQRAEEERRLEALAKVAPPADPLTADVRRRATGVLASARRANELLEQEQPREALEALREVYEHAPEELAVLQLMGQALVAAGEPEREVQLALGRAEQAERSLARAVELGDENQPTLFKLAQVQASRANWAAAARTYQRASALHPEAPTVWTQLAEAQARAGDAAGAQASLAEAERRGVPSRRIEAVRKLLAGAGAAR